MPKVLRDQVGIRPGEVEVTLDGTGLRVEPVAGAPIEERDGHLFIAGQGDPLTTDDIRELRLADQR